MKRVHVTVVLVAFSAALVLSACKDKTPLPPPPSPEPPATEEPNKEEPKAEPAKEAPGAATEKACGELYAALEKSIKDRVAKKGKKGRKAKKGKKGTDREIAARDKFMKACRFLDASVIRCLAPLVAKDRLKKCKDMLARMETSRDYKQKLDKVRGLLR